MREAIGVGVCQTSGGRGLGRMVGRYCLVFGPGWFESRTKTTTINLLLACHVVYVCCCCEVGCCLGPLLFISVSVQVCFCSGLFVVKI